MSEGFVIYALPVLQGILAIAPLPGRDGDYAQDIAHIRDWKPALVMSMTTANELAEVGATDLGADLQDAGTRWVHLPVVDFSCPDVAVDEAWHGASRIASAALAGGGRVLIHCRGGCGRSGMAALRLMIETGEAPRTALARLRALRPCVIETEAQMTWALHG